MTGGNAIGDGKGCAEGVAGAEGAAEGAAGAEGSGAGGSDGAGIGGYSAAIEIPDCVTSRKEEITISESVVTLFMNEPLIRLIFTLFLALMFGRVLDFAKTC